MKKRIAWLTPSPIEGSGGIREIFNKIQALIDDGYECHAYIEGNTNIYELADAIEKYYGRNDVIIHSGWNIGEVYDLVFATIWYSAEIAQRVKQDSPGAYMIQDFEAWFNPMGDGFLLAENSYTYGLLPVTLGKWLPHKLATEFGLQSNYFDFCADTKIYYPIEPDSKRELAVCFIYQPEKPRRCKEIGLKALELLKQEIAAVKIYLYGAKSKADVAWEHVNLGILTPQGINELYNKCSLGLCISSSNPSRIPFEMMAAGLPVIDIYRDNNLYDMPDAGILLAEPTPESIAKALTNLLNDESKRTGMSEFGADFMARRPMEVEYDQFLETVHNIFQGEFDKKSISDVKKVYRQAPVCA